MPRPRAGRLFFAACALALAAACGSSSSAEDAGPNDGGAHDAGVGDAGSDAGMGDAGSDGGVIGARCDGSTLSAYTPVASLPAPPGGITVPGGFTMTAIAKVNNARELVALPNGDLLVADDNQTVVIIPGAETDGNPGPNNDFVTISGDGPTQGVAFDPASCTIFVGSQHGVYSVPYSDGQMVGTPTKIASVRTGIVAPNSDGDVHTTTSVAVAGGKLYAGVGSSCNACTEVDPTRAVILQFNLDGTGQTTQATRIRNAIALAANPATGTLWAGGAGQDNLPAGHPYEYLDPVTLHAAPADYGWPQCEENQIAYVADAGCSGTVIPRVELPAYSTLIGAAFYPADQAGDHAFPSAWRGLFIAAHGSWHASNGVYDAPSRVAFVPIAGDVPATAMDWASDAGPTQQWTEFSGGWMSAGGTQYTARATGLAVGPRGTLFLSEDKSGYVFRIRPTP